MESITTNSIDGVLLGVLGIACMWLIISRIRRTAMELDSRVAERTRAAEEAEAKQRKQAVDLAHAYRSLESQLMERDRTAVELQKLSRAVEQSPASVVITDAKGVIEYVNPKFTQLTGYTPQEVIGKTPHILSSGETSKETITLLWKTILGGEEWRGEIRNRKKNGELYWESLSISPITCARGEVTHFVCVKEDITDRKQSEAKLAKLNKDLVNAAREAGKAEIATNVLHNVGNVLNSVNVAAGVIQEKIRTSEVPNLNKAVDIMEQHLGDLGAFVTEDHRGKHLPRFFIDATRQMAGQEVMILEQVESLIRSIDHIKTIVATQQAYATGVSAVVEEVSLAELLEDAIRINSASMQRHSLQVEREFDDIEPVSVDKQKLLQIIVNLIRNAKHACDESGKDTKQLTLSLRQSSAERVVVEVRDNGVGIAAENLTRIFAHGFTTRKDGHGFGLHAAALAAEELGGSLTVHSDGPGTGALFALELPYSRVGVAQCVS